jgi:hypothetical protein
MSSSVLGLSIDCGDAATLAQFWADVLGSIVSPGPSAEFAAIDADGSPPRLVFHQVPEAKTVKNRLHLDLISSQFGAESERLLAARRHPDPRRRTRRRPLDHLSRSSPTCRPRAPAPTRPTLAGCRSTICWAIPTTWPSTTIGY